MRAMSRFFLVFIVEFGLDARPARRLLAGLCHGSGLLSSYGELQHAIESDEVQRHPLQLEWVINQGAEIDHYQPTRSLSSIPSIIYSELVDRFEQWMRAGKLDNVALDRWKPPESDLRSFMEAENLVTVQSMATLGLIEYSNASPEVRAVYDDIMQTRHDWVNNFWKALAHDPPTLRRTWESIKQIMAPGALDAVTRMEMVYLVSASNQCGYHRVAHGRGPQSWNVGRDVRRTDVRGWHGERNESSFERLPGGNRRAVSHLIFMRIEAARATSSVDDIEELRPGVATDRRQPHCLLVRVRWRCQSRIARHHLRSARKLRCHYATILLDWVACLPLVFEDPLATDL